MCKNSELGLCFLANNRKVRKILGRFVCSIPKTFKIYHQAQGCLWCVLGYSSSALQIARDVQEIPVIQCF